uniref:uncharacterized protein LOC120332593 n=1 Tax=Styela clava TaxID=7725 RepID=UPI00193A9741|nr:uncharacterized protein LOC120332593 [Styela clava]
MKLLIFACVVLGCFVIGGQTSACTRIGGTCHDYRTHNCIAGYERGKCSGNSYIRCCKPCSSTCKSTENYYVKYRDSKCGAQNGQCKHDSNYCSGQWKSSMCGGSSSRKCCVPSGGTTSGSCTLETYTASNVRGYNNKAVRIELGFENAMDRINGYAGYCKVTVWVTDSYRKDNAVVPGAIVTPAVKSNHKVGHAIDMNLQTSKGWCNSECLAGGQNTDANCFTEKIRGDGILRWGQDFRKKDPVHIDDGLNHRHASTWDTLFRKLQPVC